MPPKKKPKPVKTSVPALCDQQYLVFVPERTQPLGAGIKRKCQPLWDMVGESFMPRGVSRTYIVHYEPVAEGVRNRQVWMDADQTNALLEENPGATAFLCSARVLRGPIVVLWDLE